MEFIVDRLKAQNLAFVATALETASNRARRSSYWTGSTKFPPSGNAPSSATLWPPSPAAIRSAVSSSPVGRSPTRTQPGNWWTFAFTLAAFSDEQIDRFIAAWYAELARLGSVKPRWSRACKRQLQAAVRRPDLWRLAANPLLLTVMALVHTHKGRLPEARALLYEETIDILLWRWEQLKTSGTDEAPPLQHLLAQANRTDVDLKRVLWQLAFEAHRAGGTTDAEVADIGESQLTRALSALHPDKSRDWAYQVVEVMQLRAGLLLERVPGVYTFPHRTFQEYLAGAHLSTQADFASQATQLAAAGPFWREVILLAVGRLVYLNGETAKPLALVAELCPTPWRRRRWPGVKPGWQVMSCWKWA